MKKALCLLLSAVMIISVMAGVDLSAYAQSANEDAVQTCIITNPYYNDIVEEAAVTSQINDDIDNEASTFCYSAPAMRSTVYTADNAAKVLRDKMVARTESVSINVLTPLTNVSEIANEIFWKAVSQEFSESSVDGDYLMWHWSYVYAAGVPITMGSKNNEFLLQFELDYYSTAAQEKKVTEKVNSVLKELNLDGKSDYRKIRLIHNFVCETAKYDYEHYENDSYKVQFTTYGALIGGYAVCQGYASLFYRLCTESGVSCRVIAGGNHAWNIAKVGSKYYCVDTTWDDTSTDFYPDNADNYWSDDYTFDWFLKGSGDFENHYPYDAFLDDSFVSSYPISTETYVCSHPSFNWVIPESASCTEGFDKSYSCADCDEVFETATVPAETEHNYEKTVIAPTCTSKGYTEYKCSVCNSSYVENVTAARGHTYKNYVTQKATMSANGSIVNKCSVCGAKKSTTAIPKIATVALSTTATYYNGSVKTPGVTVKDSKGKVLKKGTDYTVTYASGRKAVGRYAVKITFKGNYSGTKTLYFNIIPKGTSINKVTAKSKGFTVSWAKQTTQTTGYQIQYSTSSNFSNAKTITMPKSSYYAKSITGLTGNKKYYVRVRTYKTTKFNGKNYNLYSGWSAAKSITTKK